MTDTVIKVENLSKRYRLGELHKQTNSFREKVVRTFSRIRHSANSKPPFVIGSSHDSLRHSPCAMPSSPDDTFWALRNISFEVKRGEIVGIIGRNGAGKTTLLKILSRITKPTEGIVHIHGRVGSLLEVGTGFHAELTGRENIFLNGAILGMTKTEIRRKFDDIVEFAEVEKFIDTPVKRYSSGMYVRLAFAVAAHLEPEILMVDEVLAVGDVDFQKKCLGKMKDVSEHGRTVLFVSHNMGMIDNLCESSILIERGRIKKIGKSRQVIFDYFNTSIHPKDWKFVGDLANNIQVTDIIINGNSQASFVQVMPSEDIEITICGRCKQYIPDIKILITISTNGMRVATLSDTEVYDPLPKGVFESKVTIPQYILRPGEYIIGVGGDRKKRSFWFYGENLVQLRIAEVWDKNCKKDQRGIINFLRGQSMGMRVVKDSNKTSI